MLNKKKVIIVVAIIVAIIIGIVAFVVLSAGGKDKVRKTYQKLSFISNKYSLLSDSF